MAEYFYAKSDLTSITLEAYNTMSESARTSLIKSVVDGFLKSVKSDSDYFISLGIPQGTTFSSVYYASSGLYLKTSSSKVFKFCYLNTFPAQDVALSFFANYLFIKINSNCFFDISFDIDDFTIPIKTVVVPPIEFSIKTYLQFMQKSSLYNSFVTGVQSTLLTKPTVQSLSDYILNIMQNFTDGMVIFDYYQWQGNDDRENFEFRMYKNFKLRVFGKTGDRLSCKTITLDHHLFSDIAGANLLDNGILINNEGLTEKVGSGLNSYQRKGYMIHGNNCDLQTLIDQIARDSSYSGEPIEFLDFDDINGQLEENKSFLTKDGLTAQQRYDQYYNEAYAKYSKLKDILGLSDSDVASYAKQEAEGRMQSYMDTYNNTVQTSLATSAGQIAAQQYNQSLAEQTVQDAKDEIAGEKAKDEAAKALEAAKVNDKAIKQKVIEYTDKLYKTVNNYMSTPKTKIELGLNFSVGDIESTGYRAFVYQIPVSEVKQ